MQFDAFLKIDGIAGEATDSKHQGEIQLDSFNWGARQGATTTHGGGSGAGRVAIQDFEFTKQVDKASPLLLLNCANGKHIPKAVMVARAAGGEQQEYLKYTFSDVMITSVQFLADDRVNGPVPKPQDRVKFTFSKCEIEYKEQKPDGTLGGAVKAGWDLKTQQPV